MEDLGKEKTRVCPRFHRSCPRDKPGEIPGTNPGSSQDQPDKKIYVYVPFSCLTPLRHPGDTPATLFGHSGWLWEAPTTRVHRSAHESVHSSGGSLVLQVRQPGIEWKTGRNPKMGKKNWPKNRKWPSARNRAEMAQKWRKHGIWGHFSIFFAIFGPFFPLFRPPRAIFYFLANFFPIFGFRPVFHSRPGGRGLTRNTCPVFTCSAPRPSLPVQSSS